MPNYCHCEIIGHLVRDVELKHLPNGSAVGTTAIAYTEKTKDKEHTSFIDLTFWGKTAEIASEYCGKGKAVLVVGRLRQESWEDRQTGGKRSKIGLQVDKLIMLGDKKQGGEPSAPRSEKNSAAKNFYDDHGTDDNLPF